jgi:PDZ domain-containing secreted protein
MAGCPRPRRPWGRPAGALENEHLTTTGHMLQDRSAPGLRTAVVALRGAVVVLLLIGAVGILYVGANGYYVLSPGNAPVVTAASNCRPVGDGSFVLPDGRPCVQIVVPAGRAHRVSGTIMMVDVYEGKPSPWQFLVYKLYKFGLLSGVGDHAEFIPAAAIIGNGTASQVNCQDTQQSVEATSAAPVAALRLLGYKVAEQTLGAQIDVVVPGTPAAAAGVRCNDLVTAIDGKPVHTAEDLGRAIRALPVGARARITVERTDGDGHTTTVQLDARLSGTPALDHQPAQPHRAFLGVDSETRTTFDFPFSVDARVGAIGGPSDGLALALGLIDTLDGGTLTGGLHVAATGEIDPAGHVIKIGGAAQKAVAVRRAGAQVFLVPAANYAAARSQAGSMKVFAVSTLQQAVADLESLGGRLGSPTPHAVAAG